ncbi:MAG TPA: ATP-binding protein [Gammaproteobacteria bacterium]|nr:ATP-binding protein [Gammaproteobacteria bacterium]
MIAPSSASGELAPHDLYRTCNSDSLPFTTTAELEDLDVAIGQGRALAALRFAVGMHAHGYNLFVLGRSGSQRRRITEEFLRREEAKRAAPFDWCYLNNFEDERKPIAIRLPRGRGAELRGDMATLIEELRGAIPAAFESERYRSSLNELNQELEERQHAALEQLQEEAKRDQLSLITTPHGFGIAPTRDGELLDHDEFERLPAEERAQRSAKIEELSAKLHQQIEQLPLWHKEHRDRVAALNREVTELAAGQLIGQLQMKYATFPQILEYLAAVRSDVLENAISFLPGEGPGLPFEPARKQPLTRYEVNLVVNHADDGAAPIVYESNPSVQNLLGRIEHLAQLGALVTNFTMIRPGALHRANGGYLILDADRLLREPLAWPALKRVLFAGEIKIESLSDLLSIASTVSLEPQPIAIDLKVILIGEREIYYLLSELDPDFGELFKVAADFENRIERTAENTLLYARMIATLARREGLQPLDRDATARVIEQSSRLLGDSAKLTTRLRDIADLLREADYWSRVDGKTATERVHVQRAIDAQIHRLDRARSETQEGIARKLVLIDTSGETVGQVNGLSVVGIGSFAFGQPSRITASVRLGTGKIVDIERETELGGPIHSKGVLILSAYLGSKYAPDTPLSLSASLVFEQSYGGVEGDSASIAEACALLSALADLPIRQWLAVTGSVNQHGRAQVIGGVNEKIEGFFDTCAARGLDGRQGVLIPVDNVPHLMLREDVVEAVRAGKFHVYPVTCVDDAIALLTGREAGQRGPRGRFPKDSVNARVERRIRELADAARRYSKPAARAGAGARVARKTRGRGP